MLLLVHNAFNNEPFILRTDHIVSIVRGEGDDGNEKYPLTVVTMVNGEKFEVAETLKQFDATFSVGRLRPA